MKDLIYRQKGKDGYYKIWHTSEKNIFIFVHLGSGSIVLRDETHPMTKGTLAFIGEEKYHYTFPSDTENYVRSKLMIASSDVERLLEAINAPSEIRESFSSDSANVTAVSGETYEIVTGIFERLSRIEEGDRYQASEVFSAAVQLMLIAAKNETDKVKTIPDHLQLAIEYINRHISEEIGIEDISAACFMSKYHLCHTFKKKLGITVMEYVLQTRITMAKELLKEGKYSVTEVSVASGFCSPSYFSRVFKEYTGVSPIKFKNGQMR